MVVFPFDFCAQTPSAYLSSVSYDFGQHDYMS